MNAIKWISAEAKKIKRAHPKKYKKWTQYIREASNKYARVKKPTARKSKPAPRRRRLGVSKVPAGLPLYSPAKAVKGIRRRVGTKKRVFKNNQRPGEKNFPLSWIIVKRDNKGFIKKGSEYFTVSPTYPRRIVWQEWEAREAKAYLKKHCLKSS